MVTSTVGMPCPVRASVTRPATVAPWPRSHPFRTSAIWPAGETMTSRPVSSSNSVNAAATVIPWACSSNDRSTGTTASLYSNSRSACRAISFNTTPRVAPSTSIDTRRRRTGALVASSRFAACGRAARNRGRDVNCISCPAARAVTPHTPISVSGMRVNGERDNTRGRMVILRMTAWTMGSER